ncbi:hypothetical protein JTE90_024086 [Oedothorax gibbosus]|uniref:Uncharacterized protein n=1 Tax=Oedothorax gibbosus TaxID=931172 RepID=A0AAV6UQU5_9ARAC|nr:hypothetical protein JTE90_024086 [Oedothorax gibbosus]
MGASTSLMTLAAFSASMMNLQRKLHVNFNEQLEHIDVKRIQPDAVEFNEQLKKRTHTSVPSHPRMDSSLRSRSFMCRRFINVDSKLGRCSTYASGCR